MEVFYSTLRDANTARQKEWDPENVLTVGFHALELGGECGEALNIVKKLERERLGIGGSRASLAKLADELADVVITADLVARKAGINLTVAIEHKFNETSKENGLATMLNFLGIDNQEGKSK